MLEALRGLHLASSSKTPPARRSRPPIEQTPSQEALLPNAKVSAGYGSGLRSTNEEETTVEDSLDSEELSQSPSDIAPQTIETVKNPTGTKGAGEGRTRAQKKQKPKPLSIA